MLSDYLPVLLQILVAIGFAASMLIASVVFGKLGRRTGVKDDPYECGMLPVGEGSPALQRQILPRGNAVRHL